MDAILIHGLLARVAARIPPILVASSALGRRGVGGASWEDVEFRPPVEATGRKKLIMAALWTEVCLAFPALDALRHGYEVFPVVDAVGGTSPEAHRWDWTHRPGRAQPIGWVSQGCELQRNWARTDTVPDVVDIVLTSRLQKGLWSPPALRRGGPQMTLIPSF
jgi:hypothetical protein